MLWLALHFPDLPLEVFTRGTTAPDSLIVSEGQGREQRVLRANSAATCRGIAPGMRVSAALALANGLRVRVRDVPAERNALERLAAWSGQYSSLVHVVTPQTLLLEVGGSLRLFRDLPSLLARIEFGIAELGYAAQLSVAPTPLAATWLACAGHDAQITDGARLVGVLSELPLAVLELAPESRACLEGMGLKRVGDCLRLPRAGLAKRLGPELVLKLDRALGRVPDPRAPFVPAASFASRLELPGTVENVQGLTFALHRLVLELSGELRARAAGVMQLTLTLLHPKAPATLIELGLVAPTREPKHLIELFRERLAQCVLPEAVETLVLRAQSFLPLATPNLDLFGARPESEESAAALIERLRARLGQQAVQGLAVVAEHRPERAHVYDRAHSGAKAAAQLVAHGERPFWLLPEPVPLEQDGDQPLIGSALLLESGAERIESGWWDEGDIGRDYFVARNRAGECYWIFRELKPAPRWWLHGIFG
jgi:protein ImuB